MFDRCPGGPGHLGPSAIQLECRLCLIPSRDDLTVLLDAILVSEGVVLPRAKIVEMARGVRSYFAGRFGLPFEMVEDPDPDPGS